MRQGLNATHAGEIEVEKDEVGLLKVGRVAKTAKGDLGGAELAEERDVGFVFQGESDDVPVVGIVLDEHDFDRGVHFLRLHFRLLIFRVILSPWGLRCSM